MRSTLGLILLFLWSATSLAQGLSPALPPPDNGWVRLNAEQWGLWQNGVQIGNLKDGQFYRKISPNSWASDPSEPPVQPPEAAIGKRKPRKPRRTACGCSKACACKAGKCGCSVGKRCHEDCCCHQAGDPDPETTQEKPKNFGLDLDKLANEGKHSQISGREVSKKELLQAIQGGSASNIGKDIVPNDAGLLCLTAIGSPADCQAVLDDLKKSPFLEPWKNRLKVKSYAPDHWAVRDAGFFTSGHPTIYLQKANGEVLHRQDEYRGAKALSEALRKIDPQYDSQKDPDLNRTGFSSPNVGVVIWLVMILLILGGLGLVFALGLLFLLFIISRLLNCS